MSREKSFLSRLWRATPFAGPPDPLVTVIELSGVIAGDRGARRGLNLKRLEKTIDAAFRPRRLSAVALAINSPGGSPVQSNLILQRIRSLAEEKKVPVLAFIEDIGASGGYMLALAGDEIYADASSIIGSIGVVASGFGFVEALQKVGVERRAHVAGRDKAQLDPFQAEDPAHVEHLQGVLDDIHRIFIDLVRTRRDGKLSDRPEDEEMLFTGKFWAAGEAARLGLIDGLAHLHPALKARFGEDVDIRRIPLAPGGLASRFLGGGARQAAGDVLDAVEARALWSRYGL